MHVQKDPALAQCMHTPAMVAMIVDRHSRTAVPKRTFRGLTETENTTLCHRYDYAQVKCEIVSPALN